MSLDIATSHDSASTVLRLSGRVDHETSASLSAAIESAAVGSVALDMSGCDYLSSAGLRVLLVAHQNLTRKGHSLSLFNVPPVIYSVFEVTGLDQLLHVDKAPRPISLDGAELISSGACGDCYRLDAETVVKLYREGVDPGIAEKEKKYAKAALLLGLPTALSYDVVACGGRTGVVYEMIDAQLFSAIIRDDPAHTAEYARLLSDIAKGVHSIKGDPQIFPRIKEQFVDYLGQLGAFLPPSDISFLRERLQLIPDSETCVHFDLHSSNIMMRKNEPIIIDLGDLSIGSYLFDIGLVYMIYGLPELGFCEMVTRMPSDQGVKFCESFISSYFADRPAADYEFFHRNRFFLASLRAIYTVTFLPYLRPRMIELLRNVLLPKMRASL
ncbi:MAG: anti-sigma factor antagonist [Hyphomicrobiales bacterium]